MEESVREIFQEQCTHKSPSCLRYQIIVFGTIAFDSTRSDISGYLTPQQLKLQYGFWFATPSDHCGSGQPLFGLHIDRGCIRNLPIPP